MKNISKFINKLFNLFKVEYNSNKRININTHKITFDDCESEILDKNKLDCLLINLYKNEDNIIFNV